MNARRLLIAAAVLIAIVAVAAAGCTGTDTGAQPGDTVAVYYTLTVDGTQVESNVGSTPLTFTIGDGSMVSGFNDAVIGMEAGETKTVTLPPEQAYGYHDDALVLTIPLESISGADSVKAGDVLYMTTASGAIMPVTVLEVTKDKQVIIDCNPKFAGKTLTFEITLAAINP